MDQVSSCPDDQQLLRILHAQVAPQDLEAFATHLEQCQACAERLDRSLDGDSLLEAMQAQSTMPGSMGDPAVQTLVGRMLQLHSNVGQITDTPQDATADVSNPATADTLAKACDFLAPPQAPDEIGRLGPYRVLKLLGSGGMGLVFQAEDIHLKRQVALKVMKPEAAQKPMAAERFLREAQAAAAVEHKHIVSIHHVGEARGVPYLAMQWLRGMSLEDRLNKHPALKPVQIVRMGQQIALGLAAAHEQGLIHRDIKPANLWLEASPTRPSLATAPLQSSPVQSEAPPSSQKAAFPTPEGGALLPAPPLEGADGGGRIKILDFGLARLLVDDVQLTQHGALLGTPAYMSPEQARGSKVDHRSDLFSLGVVLYRMVTSRLPFQGETTMAILTSLAIDQPERPRALDLPEELSDLIMHLLAKDPAQRPTSAQEVADRLQRIGMQLGSRGVEPAKTIDRPGTGDPAPATPLPLPSSLERGVSVGDAPQSLPFLQSTSKGARRRPVAIVAALGGLALLVAGAVFFLQTPTGTVRIEINDDSINAILTRNGAVIKGVNKAQDISVAAGENSVKIKRGDLEFETDKFILKKDGQITLKVELLPGRIQVVHGDRIIGEGALPAADVPDPDRKAAEYVLSIGGTVRVNHQGDLKTAGDLPRFYFRLTGVELRGNPQVNDAGLANIKDCKNVTGLILSKTQVSDAGLAHFKDCKDLLDLRLDNTQVSDAGLAYLEACPNLQILNLSMTKVGNEGLAHFKDSRHLLSVELDSTFVSDTGLAFFNHFTNLSLLSLADTRVSDAGLAHLKYCKDLKALYLTNDKQVRDAGLGHLRDCKKLSHLNLYNTQVSDAGLVLLKDCKSLMQVSLQGTKVTAAGIDDLKKALPRCQIDWDGGVIESTVTVDPDRRAAEYVLSIGGIVRVNEQAREIKTAVDLPRSPFQLKLVELRGNTQVSDAGLVCFAGCKNLTNLDLSNTRVSDTGLIHFKNCKNLTDLRLDNTQVRGAGLAYFDDCRNLTLLNLGWTKVGNEGLAHFKNCKNLNVLGLISTQVSDAGLAYFKDCKHVRTLSLGWTGVSDAGLAYFKECKNLTNVHLDHTSVSNAGLALFKQRANLRFLALANTKLSDPGLANFKDCKELTFLDLGHTQVSDAGLAHFNGCKNLIWLYLNHTQVTDAALTYFQECKNLTNITLQKTKVTAAGIDTLKQALPRCKIEWDGGVLEPTASIDPDRNAAEYVLSIGGVIQVNGRDRELKTTADLPRQPFRLTLVNLGGNKEANDAGLVHFAGCKYLTHLYLNKTQVTNTGLANFKDCKNLMVLGLGTTQVSDAALANFEGCKNLIDLNLGWTQVGDGGLAHFQDCKDLTVLGLGNTRVSDAGLGYFKNSKNLRSLALGWTEISDVGLAHFKDCKDLFAVQLDHTNVSDKGLAIFNGRTNLRLLTLSHTQASDAGLAHFKDCKDLTILNLGDTQVSDVGLAHFKGCKNLMSLTLHNTQVTDAGLAIFKDCKNLTELTLQKTKVTTAGIDKLMQALPRCKIEWDGGVIEPKGTVVPERKAAP